MSLPDLQVRLDLFIQRLGLLGRCDHCDFIEPDTLAFHTYRPKGVFYVKTEVWQMFNRECGWGA